MTTIERGMQMRARANELEAEAKLLKLKANNLVRDELVKAGKAIKVEGIGSMVYVAPSTRSKLDIDKFKLTLAQKGVGMDVIMAAQEVATGVTIINESIKFTGVKV